LKPPLTDLRPIPIIALSRHYGPSQPLTWDDFVYRGEKISNRVPDLKKIIEYRKTKDSALLTQSLTKIQQEKPFLSEIEIEIDSNGKVKMGTQIYGLDSIKSILNIAKILEYRLKVIVDPSYPNFRYINRNKFCMCYNYKGNLNESNVLIEFPPRICDVYFRANHENDEIFKCEDGLILADTRYSQITDEQYQDFVKIGSSDSKMQLRALHRAHQLFRDETIYYSFNNKCGLEISAPPPIWGVWDTEHPDSQEKSSSLIKEAHKVVVIDQDRCMGCGTCHDICPHEAISFVLIHQDVGIFEGIEGRKATIDGTKCYHCSKCVAHCPVNAIYIREWPSEETG